MEKPRECIPFALFDDLPLDLPHGSVVGSIVSELSGLCDISLNNPRRQLIYRLAYGLTEVAQFLSIHSPIKGSADVGAAQPELDVFLFVHHRILDIREPEVHRRRISKNVP
jgi:hypothetical protein